MKNKELIELITELKQQLDESRDTDFDNYVGKLSKRASKVISELEVNNVVLDDVNGTCCEKPNHATEVNDMFESWVYCKNCNKDII